MRVNRLDCKIKVAKLVCSATIFVFLPPPLFSYIESIWNVISFIKMVFMAGIVVAIIPRYKSLSIMSLLVVSYYSCFIISTVITQGNIVKSLHAVVPQSCFFIFTDYMLKKETEEYVTCLSHILLIYIFLNAFLLLIFPDGIGRLIPGYNYNQVDSRLSILGLDNTYIRYFIIAIVVFYFVYARKEIIRNILYLMMLATMVYVLSGNGIICLTVFLAYIYLVDKGKLKRLINARTALICGAVLYILIVFLRTTSFASSFINQYLGKDMTFTGRTLLWDRAMVLISQQPLFGYGVYDYDLLISSANGQAYSAHNTVLQMMLMGGITVLITFMLLVFVSGRKVERSKNTFGKNMIIMAMLTMWIAGLIENMVLDYTIILLFVLGGHYKNIANIFSKQLRKKDAANEGT